MILPEGEDEGKLVPEYRCAKSH